MRQRHFPRLCRACRAPMARQEAECWRCGIKWAAEAEPRNALRLISGGAPTSGAAQAERDADRRLDDEDSIVVEAMQVVAMVTLAPR